MTESQLQVLDQIEQLEEQYRKNASVISAHMIDAWKPLKHIASQQAQIIHQIQMLKAQLPRKTATITEPVLKRSFSNAGA